MAAILYMANISAIMVTSRAKEIDEALQILEREKIENEEVINFIKTHNHDIISQELVAF